MNTGKKSTMRSKVLIIIAVLLIVASPFVLLYSPKVMHWLQCGNGSGSCGGLVMDLFVNNVYAVGLALFVAFLGCVLIYIAMLDNMNKP